MKIPLPLEGQEQDEVAMCLRLEDELRDDAAGAIKVLQGLGVYVAMLTGDERKAADAVAQTLGIQERRGQRWSPGGHVVPRDEKGQGVLDPRQEPGHRDTVCMLGDGLNDGPALAAADLGVAIASGLQLTCDAADVVIGSGGSMLKRFVQALHFAKRCKECKVRSSVGQPEAICVKLLALGLAFTGHLYLTLGVLSDSGSLLLVAVGVRLFAPEKGGHYEVWLQRPLHQALVDYAAIDVKYLLPVKAMWFGPSSKAVFKVTQDRLQGAIQAAAPAKGQHMSVRDFSLGLDPRYLGREAVAQKPRRMPRNTDLFGYGGFDDFDFFD
eukprot:Skav222454  [mRNA]  locus=scaffold3319:66870:88806:+ [translate_table: standard]